MRYLAAHFCIQCDPALMQTVKDLIADMAGEAGFESFEDTPSGLDGYVQEQLMDRGALEQALADFPIDGVNISYIINKVEDQDWNREWEEQGFEPIRIDRRMVIYDAKMPTPSADEGAILIGIDARQAFGTGTHETTQMIIATLLDMNLRGLRTLDCGTGTGILSIAAAKLGAAACVGYDIDEWSVNNARHNGDINHVVLDIRLGDARVTDTLTTPFDVVMANINRNILLADMERFVRVMATGATLILSGFYPTDIPKLNERATALGLQETARHTLGDWACLVFGRA